METERWVVDRIEDGQHVVLSSERGGERVVPRSKLPAGAREGDALKELSSPAGEVLYAVDPEATERLKEEAEQLRSSLRRGPSGPISL